MYIHVKHSSSPLLITVPHDGEIKIDGAPIRPQVQRWIRNYGGDHRDQGSRACAEACAKHLSEMGLPPTLIALDLYRGHVDVNRGPDREPFVLPDEHGFAETYRRFHVEVDRAINQSLKTFGRCLLIDLHTFVNPPGKPLDIVLGTDECRTCSPILVDRLCRSLAEHHVVGQSPDHKNGITSRYRGGYIVRHAAEQFRQARETDRLNAIQIEIYRSKSFLCDPTIIGNDLARTIFSLLSGREA